MLIFNYFSGDKNRGQRTSTQAQASRHHYVISKHKPKRPPLPWDRIFKRLLKIGIIIGVVIALIWGIWAFREYKNLPVKQVQVVATYDHIQTNNLQKIISLYMANNFFDINVFGLKRDILALPWVYDVYIKRKWPNTVVIHIIEQKAVAQWKDEALLNEDGILFTPPKNTFPPHLPLLLGEEEDVGDVVKNFQKMQKLLEPLNFKITQLDVNERGAWHMVLNDNLNVLLGDNSILKRLENFINIYPKMLADHPDKVIEAVDLRYKDGAAVKVK